MSAYRKPTPPAPEREPEPKRGTRVRMAETPEEIEARERSERARLVREEGRFLAESIERRRTHLDRGIRIAGAVVTLVGIGLVTLAPLPLRAAGLAGMAVTCGPLALFLGGGGEATDAQNLPIWLRAVYGVGAFIGVILGSAAFS